MLRRIESFLIVVVAVMLTGCGAAVTEMSLGPPYEPTGVARAGVLMPLQGEPGEPGVVRVTDSEGVEHDQTSQTDPIEQGTWRMRVAGFWIVEVVRETDGRTSGGVSIVREIELTESRRVEYDPPLAMLPGALEMGVPIERNSKVRVYDHGNGVLLSMGTCTAVYRLLGNKQLTLPGRKSSGEVTATIVQTVRRYELPWVTVDMQIITGYMPGEGAVAWVTRRDVRLLGLLPMSREESAVRLR